MLKKVLVFLVFVLILVSVVVLVPLATIWSLNTLFPLLEIPFNIKTFLASLLLIMVFGSSSYIGKSK